MPDVEFEAVPGVHALRHRKTDDGTMMVVAVEGVSVNIADVEVKNDAGNPIPVEFAETPTVNVGTTPELEVKNAEGTALAVTGPIPGLSIPAHDYVALGYTSGRLTSVAYKTGGSSGSTVASLTLAYDASGNLSSVTKAA